MQLLSSKHALSYLSLFRQFDGRLPLFIFLGFQFFLFTTSSFQFCQLINTLHETSFFFFHVRNYLLVLPSVVLFLLSLLLLVVFHVPIVLFVLLSQLQVPRKTEYVFTPFPIHPLLVSVLVLLLCELPFSFSIFLCSEQPHLQSLYHITSLLFKE